MASDSNNTNHKYQTRSKSSKLPKKVYNNESSDNDEEFDFEEKDYDEESSQEKDMEPEDFHQLLAELFPSKFSKEKAKLSKKMKKYNRSQEEITNNINPDNFIILPFPIVNQSRDSDDNDSDSDIEEDENSEDSSDESLENMSIQEIEKNEKILDKFKALAKRLEKSNKDSKILKSIQKENLKKEKLLKKTLNKNEKKRKRDNQKKIV